MISMKARVAWMAIFFDYDQEKKLAFLKRCRDEGVVNFEMESQTKNKKKYFEFFKIF
jgi:hypothetical protein